MVYLNLKEMKKIGKILFVKENKAVAKLSRPVKLGLAVYSKNKVVGKIVDVFGPVSAPYAEIRLDDKIGLGKNGKEEIYAY